MRVLVVLVAAAASGGCGHEEAGTTSPGPATTAVQFRVLEEALVSAVVPPRDKVQARLARSRGEWISMWEEITANRAPPRPPPVVDFSREQVVLVHAGPPARSARTTSVHRTAGGLRIDVQVSQPAPGCGTTADVRSPYQFLLIPKTNAQQASVTIKQVLEPC